MSLSNGSHDSIKVDTTIEIEHFEAVPISSAMPRNPPYIEKDGLTIVEDGVDHSHYNPHSIRFIMTVVGCSCSLAGSTIVPLLYLSLGTTIALDLNASNLAVWIFSAMIVSTGALAPFIGPLADLFERRTLLLAGLIGSTIGAVVCAATSTAVGFIAGQILIGAGAVTQELIVLAVISEIVPTTKRSLYTALVLCTLLPWTPATLYANWIAEVSWRWIGCLIAGWNMLTFGIIAVFYHPPPRLNSLGLSRKEIIDRIDFVGGILITLGLLFVLIGINWGGQEYPWQSAHVISFLAIGICVLVGFGFWEMFGAQYPLYPRRIIKAPRPFTCLLIVIFMASINFVPLIAFWPIESISVFGADHHQTGLNSLPIGLCIIGGAVMSALMIGIFRRHITLIMTIFCITQTVAFACLTVINPYDIRTAWAPMVLGLIGVGGTLVPTQVMITVITPDDLLASVVALTVGLRVKAQVIGLAIFYNRFMTDVAANAVKYLVPAMLEIGVSNSTDITELVNGLTAMPLSQFVDLIPELQNPANFELVKEATITCFSQSLLSIYYIMIAFGGLACIAAASMGDVSQYLNDRVAVVI